MKKKLLIAGIVVVVVVGLIIYNLRMKDRGSVPVQTETAARGDIAHVVTASGYIQPRHSVDISADVAGRITKLRIDEGNEVDAGDTLLIIDPAPYEADVARARAELRGYLSELVQARRNLERANEIYESQKKFGGESLISEEELDTARTKFEVAQQRVEGARASLRRTEEYLKKITVTAPMSGTVTSLDVEEGEVAVIGTMNNPGTVLLTISDLSEMEAEVQVDETDVVSLELSQPSEISIDAYPDTSFAGRVSEIGNSPIISTRGAVGVQEAVDFLVKVSLDEPPAGLKPGLSATAEITTETRQNTVNIPIQAIVVRNVPAGEDSAAGDGDGGKDGAEALEKKERKGVFVVEDGKAVFHPVKTGIVGGMDIEIVEGIEEGDEVVIGSYKILRTLEDGDGVTVEDAGSRGSE